MYIYYIYIYIYIFNFPNGMVFLNYALRSRMSIMYLFALTDLSGRGYLSEIHRSRLIYKNYI